MESHELPAPVAAKIDAWSDGTILHWWDYDETYYVVMADKTNLYFLRVFQIGNAWHLSQDNAILGKYSD